MARRELNHIHLTTDEKVKEQNFSAGLMCRSANICWRGVIKARSF